MWHKRCNKVYMGKINGYILTFEAIAKTRHELELAIKAGDTMETDKVYDRLCNLYASIDAETVVSELKQLTKLVA